MQKIMMSEANTIIGGCKKVELISYDWNADYLCEETKTLVNMDKNGNVKKILGSSSKIVDDNFCGGGV